jgi:hypothetical protein
MRGYSNQSKLDKKLIIFNVEFSKNKIINSNLYKSRRSYIQFKIIYFLIFSFFLIPTKI